MFLSLFASRIPLHRPIGILSDLCTIIERAMYIDRIADSFSSYPIVLSMSIFNIAGLDSATKKTLKAIKIANKASGFVFECK